MDTQPLVQHAIQAAILALFAWLIRPKRRLGDGGSGACSLRSHWGMRVLAVLVGLLGVFLLLLSGTMFLDPEGIPWGQALACTGLSLGVLYWVARVFSLRVEADARGVRYAAGFRKVEADWGSVEAVDWNPRAGCHRVRTRRGSFPVSSSLEGAGAFLGLCARHRPDLRLEGPGIPVPVIRPE